METTIKKFILNHDGPSASLRTLMHHVKPGTKKSCFIFAAME
jgi:hypothetical protein